MIDSYNVMWLNDNYVIKYSVCGGVSTRMNYSVVFQSIQCFSATSDFGCYLSLARVLVPESQLAPVRIVKSQKVQTRIYRSTETALSPIVIDLTCYWSSASHCFDFVVYLWTGICTLQAYLLSNYRQSSKRWKINIVPRFGLYVVKLLFCSRISHIIVSLTLGSLRLMDYRFVIL